MTNATNTKVAWILTHVIPNINSELNCINSGGCGVFAHELHKALKVRGIKSEVVLAKHRCGWATAANVRRLIDDSGCKGINTAYQKIFKEYARTGHVPDVRNDHLALRFDGNLYDSHGEYDYPAISEGITSKTMEEFLRMPRCWNTTFERSNGGLSSVLGTLEDFFAEAFKSVPVTHRLNGSRTDASNT